MYIIQLGAELRDPLHFFSVGPLFASPAGTNSELSAIRKIYNDVKNYSSSFMFIIDACECTRTSTTTYRILSYNISFHTCPTI